MDREYKAAIIRSQHDYSTKQLPPTTSHGGTVDLCDLDDNCGDEAAIAKTDGRTGGGGSSSSEVEITGTAQGQAKRKYVWSTTESDDSDRIPTKLKPRNKVVRRKPIEESSSSNKSRVDPTNVDPNERTQSCNNGNTDHGMMSA